MKKILFAAFIATLLVFTAASNAQLVSEDFNSTGDEKVWPPTGWILHGTTGSEWIWGETPFAGLYNAETAVLVGGEAGLLSCEWCTVPLVDPAMTFWYRGGYTSSMVAFTAEVATTRCCPSQFIPVWDSGPFSLPDYNDDYAQVEIDLAAYAGQQILFGFRCYQQDSASYPLQLDEVWVGQMTINAALAKESFDWPPPPPFPPAGWTQNIYSGDGVWLSEACGNDTYEPLNCSGYYADCDDDDFALAYDVGLMSPSMDMTGDTNVTIEFDRNFQDFAGYGQAEIRTYSSGGLEQVLLWLDVDDPAGGVHTVLNFDPSAYADPSDVQIEWWYTDDGYGSAWKFCIDNVDVYGLVTYLTEGFGDPPAGTFPPTGWSIQTAGLGNTWYHGTYHDGGTASIEDGPGASTHQDEWFITPTIDCNSVFDTQLRFWHDLYVSTASGDSTAEVYGSIDDGATWPYLIDSWQVTDTGIKAYDISTWADDKPLVKIAFRFNSSDTGSDYDTWDLDDVFVGQTCECTYCYEGFEEVIPGTGFPPPGWSTTNYGTGNGWIVDNKAAEAPLTWDGWYAQVDSDDSGSGANDVAALFTPSFDVSGIGAQQVNVDFSMYFNNISTDYCEVRTNSAGGYEATIASYAIDTTSDESLWFDPSGYVDPSDVEVEFFYDAAGAWAWWWSIDNVLITVGLPPPGGLDQGGGDDQNSGGFQAGNAGIVPQKKMFNEAGFQKNKKYNP